MRLHTTFYNDIQCLFFYDVYLYCVIMILVNWKNLWSLKGELVMFLSVKRSLVDMFRLFNRRHEPIPTIWHRSWQTGSKVLVQGGKPKQNRSPPVVEVFDANEESWQQEGVNGEGEAPGPKVFSAACASVEDKHYTFGGRDGDRDNYYNTLHVLSVNGGDLKWKKLCPQNELTKSPMPKSGAGMVAFDDNLAVFGGYGKPHDTANPGSTFIRDVHGAGWTNEFHIYNRSDDTWCSPAVEGEIPPPCAAFTLTSTDNGRAVLFGGRGEQGRMNDVYIIDLLTMHWTKLNKSGYGPWPEGRAGHAACCLNYGQQHPQLLVTGGLNRQNKVLGDAWILNVNSEKWKKVESNRRVQFCRRGHSITAVCLTDGVTDVIMFGGSAKPRSGDDEDQKKMADTTSLLFCCFGQSKWELLSVKPFSEFQSEERLLLKKIVSEVGEKMVQMQRECETLKASLEEREKMPQQVEQRAQEAPNSQNPDFGHFGKPTQQLLMNLVGCKVKNKWYEIGTGLKVENADLTSIQADEAGKTDSAQRCMQHVFLKWESAMTSEYTWQNLANVLESPVVNEKAAVLDLYKSLCKHNKTDK